MKEAIQKLIDESQSEIKRLEQEIEEYSCEVNPHPDDLQLCRTLTTKVTCLRKVTDRLISIVETH